MKFKFSLNFPIMKCEDRKFSHFLPKSPEGNHGVGLSGAWELNMYTETNVGFS
jgi:hypothetical protein